MTAYVALLRAVNVGGTGKLPMAELRALADALGFVHARTYIASGNLVFADDRGAGEVQQLLAERLHGHAGKPVGVLLRTAAELAATLAANPFAHRAPSRVLVTFLDAPPPPNWRDHIRHRRDEEVAVVGRDLFIHYGNGIGTSKLAVPAAAKGTARNINTVAALTRMAAALPPSPPSP